jgi:hypothetical protein
MASAAAAAAAAASTDSKSISGERYAVLFGDTSEAGRKTLGKICDEGFTVQELRTFATAFGDKAKFTMLSDVLPASAQTAENEAAILVIEDGINLLMADATFAERMLAEQRTIPYDQFCWSRRTGKTQHKWARYNTVFADQGVTHSADYQVGRRRGYRLLEQL